MLSKGPPKVFGLLRFSAGCGLRYRRNTELEGELPIPQLKSKLNLSSSLEHFEFGKAPHAGKHLMPPLSTAQPMGKRMQDEDDDKDIASFKRVGLVDRKTAQPRNVKRKRDENGGEESPDTKSTRNDQHSQHYVAPRPDYSPILQDSVIALRSRARRASHGRQPSPPNSPQFKEYIRRKATEDAGRAGIPVKCSIKH